MPVEDKSNGGPATTPGSALCDDARPVARASIAGARHDRCELVAGARHDQREVDRRGSGIPGPTGTRWTDRSAPAREVPWTRQRQRPTARSPWSAERGRARRPWRRPCCFRPASSPGPASVEQGNTVCDHEPEEIARGMTLGISLALPAVDRIPTGSSTPSRSPTPRVIPTSSAASTPRCRWRMSRSSP